MISTKARYALRVMLDLAQQPSDQYIPLKAIAERQNISEKYLEIILKNLVKAQFLKGVRGLRGTIKVPLYFRSSLFSSNFFKYPFFFINSSNVPISATFP